MSGGLPDDAPTRAHMYVEDLKAASERGGYLVIGRPLVMGHVTARDGWGKWFFRTFREADAFAAHLARESLELVEVVARVTEYRVPVEVVSNPLPLDLPAVPKEEVNG